MRKISVPDEGAESLYGPYDENLKHLESLFNVRIRTNAHEVIVEGEAADVARAENLLEQLSGADSRRLPPGQGGRQDGVSARRTGRTRRAGGLFSARRSSRDRQAAGDGQERQSAALPRSHRTARHRLRHRSGGHRQDLPRDGAGGRVSARQAGQPDHSGAAGGRSRARSSGSCPAICRRK